MIDLSEIQHRIMTVPLAVRLGMPNVNNVTYDEDSYTKNIMKLPSKEVSFFKSYKAGFVLFSSISDANVTLVIDIERMEEFLKIENPTLYLTFNGEFKETVGGSKVFVISDIITVEVGSVCLIRKEVIPTLPAIHSFERSKFNEYQPIQGKSIIASPTNLNNKEC